LQITPHIARRGTEHGSGLGVHRWVVEGAIALLHWFRRLRIRWEIRDDIHHAFAPSAAPSSAGDDWARSACVQAIRNEATARTAITTAANPERPSLTATGHRIRNGSDR
jgi:hypothetical protein